MKIVIGPLLAHRTTLKLGGRAIAEVVVEQDHDLDALTDTLHSLGGEQLVLGEGSNILAADHDLALVLIRVAIPMKPRAVQGNRGQEIRVRAGAGIRLPRMLGWLHAHGLSGLEELTGVPGSLGGAVAMNAGSYGREMGQVLGRVLAWSPESGVAWISREQCRTGYRFFDAQVAGSPMLILAAELVLQRDEPAHILARMRRWYGSKKASQPVTAASAGCVFKNPAPDLPAGRLLEQAGMRGYRLGGMAFSDRHANFLVNLGGGRSEQAHELMEVGRQRVWNQSGLRLETEVKVVS